MCKISVQRQGQSQCPSDISGLDVLGETCSGFFSAGDTVYWSSGMKGQSGLGLRRERGECENCSLDQGPLKGVCSLFQKFPLGRKGTFWSHLPETLHTVVTAHFMEVIFFISLCLS